jgi:hypothetical protein
MRLILCLILLTVVATASAAGAGKGSPHQFIDQSIITFPKSPGPYRLVHVDYDPAHFADGVDLDYSRSDLPGLQLDIYVYPRGRADDNKAVTDAMAEIETEIRAIEQQNTYSQVHFNDAVEFDLASAPPAPNRTIGRKRALTMAVAGTPSQSLAYVFYRNLFLISARATAPVVVVSSADFNGVVDQAVRDLVPMIDVRNFGTCGNINISVDQKSSGQKSQTETNASQMLGEITRLNLEHCAGNAGSVDTKPLKGYAQKTIVYPVGTWK